MKRLWRANPAIIIYNAYMIYNIFKYIYSILHNIFSKHECFGLNFNGINSVDNLNFLLFLHEIKHKHLCILA